VTEIGRAMDYERAGVAETYLPAGEPLHEWVDVFAFRR
jgi:hypothetical protein